MSIATPLAVVATLNLRTFQVANMDERFSDGDFLFTWAITSIVSLAVCVIVVEGSVMLIAFVIGELFFKACLLQLYYGDSG